MVEEEAKEVPEEGEAPARLGRPASHFFRFFLAELERADGRPTARGMEWAPSGAGLVQLSLQSGDSVRPIHPDSFQREDLTLLGESLVGRRGA